MKRFMAILIFGLFSFALVAGCGKKQEEQPAMEQQAAPADTAMKADTSMMHDSTMADTSAAK